MSFTISIIGCIFRCRISNAANYEYQGNIILALENRKRTCANRRERTYIRMCVIFASHAPVYNGLPD